MDLTLPKPVLNPGKLQYIGGSSSDIQTLTSTVPQLSSLKDQASPLGEIPSLLPRNSQDIILLTYLLPTAS